ncbi:MAG: hypothetical protein Q6K99_00040 [Thermostichales cyanobacterium BF4_bins_65]
MQRATSPGLVIARLVGYCLLSLSLLWIVGCGSASAPVVPAKGVKISPVPPEIAQLAAQIEALTPKVTILEPKPDQILKEKKVTLRFGLEGYRIFKDPQYGLGPHLHVVLDNQPYIAYYDLSTPLTLEGLSPGSHTVRVFAGTPWHESYKNREAYAQVTFHVLAKTPEYIPDPALPLLTYNRPVGSYGAEPILVDFWLSNAPIRETLLENLPKDWRIRYTLNGESGYVNQWQPFYLSGWQPGTNIFELELVDGQDRPIRNVFNSAVREITYTPNGQDTLSRLVRGELKAQQVLSILPLAPTPAPPPEATPAATPLPTPEATPTATPLPTPEATPTATPVPTPEVTPTATPETTPVIPSPPSTAAPVSTPEPTELPTPAVTPSLPIPSELPSPVPQTSPTVKPTRRPLYQYKPKARPIPMPSTTPSPELTPSETPTPEPSPLVPEPEPIPGELPSPVPQTSPTVKPTRRPLYQYKPKARPTSEPTPEATPVIVTPSPASTQIPPTAEPEPTPVLEASPTPSPQPTSIPTPRILPTPIPKITPRPPNFRFLPGDSPFRLRK